MARTELDEMTETFYDIAVRHAEMNVSDEGNITDEALVSVAEMVVRYKENPLKLKAALEVIRILVNGEKEMI